MPSKKSEEKHEAHRNDVVTILEWEAPGRPFRKRTKQYYLTAMLITLLVEVILFLFSEYLLMLVVFSLLFVAFALAKIPPRDFKYRISSEGITIEDRFFLWQELYDFSFKNKDGYETLHISTQAYLPGELILTLGKEPQEKVKSAILPYLPLREYVRPTFVDKAADWLSRNFPLENK
jgi:hypothetical protein